MKNNDFAKCLKQEVVKWACTLNSRECTSYAVSSLMNHMSFKNTKPYGLFIVIYN